MHGSKRCTCTAASGRANPLHCHIGEDTCMPSAAGLQKLDKAITAEKLHAPEPFRETQHAHLLDIAPSDRAACFCTVSACLVTPVPAGLLLPQPIAGCEHAGALPAV